MGNNYSRSDLVTAIVLALIIAVWLIVYAVLMILYGHDRSAGSAGRGDWRRETTRKSRMMCCTAQPASQGAASLVGPSIDLPRDGVPRSHSPSQRARNS